MRSSGTEYSGKMLGESAFTLTVRDEKGRVQAKAPCPDTVSGAVNEAGLGLEMPCGGRGACGKCGVLFTDGAPEPSDSDRSFFSERELKQGYRLACTARLMSDASIRLPEYGSRDFYAVTGEGGQGEGVKEGRTWNLSLDIGTTTLAAALVSDEGDGIFYGSAVNSSRIFGADVLSRISAYEGSEGRRITDLIRSDAAKLAMELMKKAGCTSLGNVVISANTAMQHMFAGESCRGLMAHPFDAGNISLRTCCIDEEPFTNVPVTLLPGLSAFVGADIVSGIYSLSILEKKEKCLFLDLGTNAEIALYNGSELFVTSASAGPAFEGGQISCGTGSVKGAICRVREDNKGNLQTGTIGDAPPAGICGTGLIDILGILTERGILLSGFGLPEEYREYGFPVAKTQDGKLLSVTQKDIEALKLAIAAVNTGIRILSRRSGESDLSGYRAYIVGGFGAGLCEESAFDSGLLPLALKGNVVVSGNTSLAGAVMYLKTGGTETFETIISHAVPVELAETPEFNEEFLRTIVQGG